MNLYVILHNIRSLYNVGSLFRTCDGAGIDELYLTGYTGYPPRKEITKTALGAEESVPWKYQPDIMVVIQALRNSGISIVAVERTEDSQHYLEIAYPPELCLIFGNEVTGLEPEILAMVDTIVHVPMHGIKESLNVAVCGGVVLYGVLGQNAKGRPNGPPF